MIAHLRGKVLAKEPGWVVLDCGGVGYEALISVPTYVALPPAGAEATLHIHLHAREDALLLFGFKDRQEKELFHKLLVVSGIGPTLAIKVLSGISTERLVGAIRAQDHATLTKIPGVGKKTAERIVVELKDKLDNLVGFTAGAGVPAATSLGAVADDVLSALVNLGYPRPAAQKAVETAAKDGAVVGEFEGLFRAAMAAVK